MKSNAVHFASICLTLCVMFSGCKEPEPITRCVIDRVEVLATDPDYFEDTVDEGPPDLYVELARGLQSIRALHLRDCPRCSRCQ